MLGCWEDGTGEDAVLKTKMPPGEPVPPDSHVPRGPVLRILLQWFLQVHLPVPFYGVFISFALITGFQLHHSFFFTGTEPRVTAATIPTGKTLKAATETQAAMDATPGVAVESPAEKNPSSI